MTQLQRFDYSHDGLNLIGQLALPDGPGPHPAILVMHDARGLGDNARRRARMLAEAGYVALATDMFGDGRFFEDAYSVASTIAPLMNDADLLRGRANAGLEALRARPDVDAARIGAIGFCFGGECVLELARAGAELRACASFHGLLQTKRAAAPGAVRAKLLVLTGGLDPYVPQADVRAFEAEMTAAGADYHLTVYSDGHHAFSDPRADEMTGVPGVRYDPLIDRLAWAQAMAFLDAVVRG